MKKKIRIGAFIFFALLFFFSGFMLFKGYLEYKEGNELYTEAESTFVTEINEAASPPVIMEIIPDAPGDSSPSEIVESSDTPGITVNFSALQAVNKDIIAWIKIPDTVVSYPLLRGVDNEKYLKTTYNNKYSKFGSIFLDKVNASDFSDEHSIIYGHNIKNGAMFGDLSSYRKQDFLESHRYVYILTPEHCLQYEIFSAHKTGTTDGVFIRKFENKDEFKSFLNLVNKFSWITPINAPTTKDKIITLSTCTSSEKKEERFVVHAFLVKSTDFAK